MAPRRRRHLSSWTCASTPNRPAGLVNRIDPEIGSRFAHQPTESTDKPVETKRRKKEKLRHCTTLSFQLHFMVVGHKPSQFVSQPALSHVTPIFKVQPLCHLSYQSTNI